MDGCRCLDEEAICRPAKLEAAKARLHGFRTVGWESRFDICLAVLFKTF